MDDESGESMEPMEDMLRSINKQFRESVESVLLAYISNAAGSQLLMPVSLIHCY